MGFQQFSNFSFYLLSCAVGLSSRVLEHHTIAENYNYYGCSTDCLPSLSKKDGEKSWNQ